jgi:hypothetical protein
MELIERAGVLSLLESQLKKIDEGRRALCIY